MKYWILIFSLVFISRNESVAQEAAKPKPKNNNIQLQADIFYITKFFEKDAFTVKHAYVGSRGLSYMRQLYPNWSVRIGYNSLWNSQRAEFVSTREKSLFDTNNIGKLYSRSKWKFADLEVNYSKKWKQHRFAASAGASFCQTKNSYIKNLALIYYPNRAPHLIVATLNNKTEQYWGGLVGLHYDYLFWKNRIAAGADFKLRFYKNVPHSYNVYGIHVGYNF